LTSAENVSAQNIYAVFFIDSNVLINQASNQNYSMTNHEKISAKKKITIGVAEDHPLYRRSIVDHISLQDDFQIVFEAENGADLLEKLQTETPAVVLLDLHMPVLSGNKALLEIKKLYPQIKIVILSLDNDSRTIIDTKTSGASAFVDKGKSTSENFFAVIRDVYYDKHNFDIEPLLNNLKKPSGNNHSAGTFTKKEKQIMPLMAKRHTSAEIATHLNSEQRTIEWHRSNILHKTNSNSLDDFIFWYNVHFASLNKD
jgi:DNA-binding NarL/FixJ family response regulator